MATVGSLIYNLKARTDDFAKGTKKAESLAASASNKIKGVFDRIVFNIDLIHVARSLKTLVTSAGDHISKVNDAADRLGASTEGLIGYSHAAQLAGVEQEALFQSLNKMNVAIGKTVRGGKGISGTLKELGLDAANIASVGTDQAFLKIADALDKVENPAKKAAMAQEIFGKSGAKMLNVIKGGAPALRDAIQQAEKLGLSFSKIDALTVDNAMDQLEAVLDVLKGIGIQLTVKLGPYIQAFGESLLSSATTGVGAIGVIDEALSGVGSTIRELVLRLGEIPTMFKIMHVGILELKRDFGTFVDKIPGVLKILSDRVFSNGFIPDFRNWNKPLSPAEFATIQGKSRPGEDTAIKTAIDELQKMLLEKNPGERFTQWMDDADAKTASLIGKLGQIKTPIDDATLKMHEFAKSAEDIIEKTRTPLEKFQEEMRKINEAFLAGAITGDVLNRARKLAEKEFMKDTAGKFQLPGAAEKGSKEAYSISARSNMPSGNDIQSRIVAELRKSAKVETAELPKIRAAVEKIGKITPVGFNG